jgi:hypothetical protein
MTLHAPIVLFTEEHLAPIFRAMRPPHLPLHIVILSFEELETWSGEYPEQWCHQHTLNPEGHIQGQDDSDGHIAQQTAELYAVWAHKPAFVERAVHQNPFSTEFFFWCDIGAFREPVPPTIQERFPETKWLMRNRILFQAMSPIAPHERERQPDGLRGLPITSTGKEACLAWKRACDAMRQRFLTVGRYAGNDQAVMLSALLEQPSLGLVIKPYRWTPDMNPWFFMEYVLSSVAECKVDVSYL